MSDWKVTSTIPQTLDPVPGNNISASPVGAPEGMPSDQFNNVDRYDKAGIRQNYDDLKSLEAFLGNMAAQDPASVNITGGSLAGEGSGLTNLNASNLSGGVVPADRLNGYYPDARVGQADTISGFGPDAMVPVGGIIEYYGPRANVDSSDYWAICDGTRNTPDLRDAYTRAASQDSEVNGNKIGSGSVTVPLGGGHSHTGNTGGTALTESQMPIHEHDNVGKGQYGSDEGENYSLISKENGEEPGAPTVIKTESAGGGQEHLHSIAPESDHGHGSIDLDDNTTHVRLWKIMRIA